MIAKPGCWFVSISVCYKRQTATSTLVQWEPQPLEATTSCLEPSRLEQQRVRMTKQYSSMLKVSLVASILFAVLCFYSLFLLLTYFFYPFMSQPDISGLCLYSLGLSHFISITKRCLTCYWTLYRKGQSEKVRVNSNLMFCVSKTWNDYIVWQIKMNSFGAKICGRAHF